MNLLQFPPSTAGKHTHRRHAPKLYCYTWMVIDCGGRWFRAKQLIAWRPGKTKVLSKWEADKRCRELNASTRGEG